MVAIILEATGALLVSLGVALIFPPAGVITLGIFSVLFGISLERK